MRIITRHFTFINRLLTKRYLFLLISLCCLIFVPSFFYSSPYYLEVTYLLEAITVIGGIYTVQESRFQLRAGVILGLLVIIVNWIGAFQENATLNFYFSFVSFIFFFCFVSYKLINKVFATPQVTSGVLYASIIIYLLFGIIGGFGFMLIENAYPNSLSNLELVSFASPSEFIYYSFVTLSTLGYGDIAPISPPARSLSIFLGILGPLYLTVLVALIVGRYVSTHHK